MIRDFRGFAVLALAFALALASASSIGNGGGGGGGGTVTTVSVANANGFSGTVANPTTTPAISLIPSSPGVTNPSVCPDTSNSATALVCSSSPTFVPATNNSIILVVGTSPNSGTITVNVNGSGAKTIKKLGGSTNLAANDLAAGQRAQLVYDGTNWQLLSEVANGAAGAQNLFSSIVVATQPTVTATSPTTALTLVAGTNVTLTTNNATKTVTVNSSGGGGGGGSISSGVFAGLGAPGALGATYLFTDSCFEQAFSDGTNWHYLSDGNELFNPTGLSWVNQTSGGGSATVDSTQGGEIVSSPNVAGANLRLRLQALPMAAPYTIQGRIAIAFEPGQFPTAGLALQDSVSGKLELFGLYGGNDGAPASLNIQAFKNSSPTGSFDGNYLDFGFRIGASRYLWFQIDDNATTKTFSYSFDGQNWALAGSAPSTGYMTADHYGFFLQSQGKVSTAWFQSLSIQ